MHNENMAGRHYCQSFIPPEKGGSVWKETDAKHLLILDRCSVVGKNSLNPHPPNSDEVF